MAQSEGSGSEMQSHRLGRSPDLTIPGSSSDSSYQANPLYPANLSHHDDPPHQAKEQFEYTSLCPGDFRVFELQPGEHDDDIVVSLFHQQWQQKRPFEAVSYTWADADSTDSADTRQVTYHSIECNDRTLEVPSNLVTALRYFRLSTTSRLLWADSICINQHDASERSEQVRRMGDIYASADRALAWIGRCSKTDLIVIGALKRCLRECYDAFPEQGNDWRKLGPQSVFRRIWTDKDGGTSPYFRFYHDELVSINVPIDEIGYGSRDYEYTTVICLKRLLLRNYFTRAWIIQETALARETLLHWDQHALNWDELANCIRIITKWLTVASEPLDFIVRLLRMYRCRYGQSRTKHFFPLIELGKWFDCSDPKDHIYAMLGLMNDDFKQHMTIDYSRSVAMVYRQAIAEALCVYTATINTDPHWYNDLSILAGLSPEKTRLGLPSWTLSGVGSNLSDMTLFFNRRYQAAGHGHSATQCPIYELNGVLGTRGCILGRVDDLSAISSPPLPSHPVQGHLRWVIEARTFISVVLAADMSLPAIEETFWRTLTWDSDWKHSIETSSCLRMPAVSSDLYTRLVQISEHLSAPKWERDQSTRNKILSQEQWQELRNLLQGVNFGAASQLAVLNEKMIARVPMTAAVGDMICIIAQASTPSVIRKLPNGHYKYVGWCFVHGAMYGEKWPEDLDSLEDILLE